MREIPVCQKAFIALHGITKRRLATIQSSVKEIGKSAKDKRGTHNNRSWKISKETEDAVMTHIGSFHRRKSHYGKGKSDKIDLSEELSIKNVMNCMEKNIQICQFHSRSTDRYLTQDLTYHLGTHEKIPVRFVINFKRN